LAKNDAILRDVILSDRLSVEGLDKGELFELFAFEQVLKSYDLTRKELEQGWVDGKDDGGIALDESRADSRYQIGQKFVRQKQRRPDVRNARLPRSMFARS